MKPRWDPRYYVNIWLVKEIYFLSVGAGTAGYALLPYSHGRPEEGIVNEARYFGSSTDNSQVHVHEMGHYLGPYVLGRLPQRRLPAGRRQGVRHAARCLRGSHRLRHLHQHLHHGCLGRFPTEPVPPASGGTGDQPDMTINYMDYSHQACQSAFTEGQRQRMLAAISTVRSGLLESSAYQHPCLNSVLARIGPVAAEVTLESTLTLRLCPKILDSQCDYA